MQTPSLAGILIAVGVILVLASAFADSLGRGAEATRFGWKQTLGVLLGLAAIVAGLYLRSGARRRSRLGPDRGPNRV